MTDFTFAIQTNQTNTSIMEIYPPISQSTESILMALSCSCDESYRDKYKFYLKKSPPLHYKSILEILPII